MMDNDIREQMAMWLEDMLSPEEAAIITARVRDSEAYRREYDHMRRIERALRTAPSLPAPDGFTLRVQARLAQRRNRPRTWLGMGLLVLAVVVGLGLGVVLLTGSGLERLEAWGSVDQVRTWLRLAFSVVAGTQWLARTLLLVGRSLLAVLSQPVFGGYLLFTVGLFWFWMQLLRWLAPGQGSLTT